MATQNLTAELLRELLNYDPITGSFTRKTKTNRRVVVGAEAAFPSSGRYMRIAVNDGRYYAHRLAWLYVYGLYPDDGLQIDHIDGNKNNNSISNLRAVTPSMNTQNERKARPQNTTGVLGVTWNKLRKKWRAEIRINSNKVHLGLFDSQESASIAYLEAKRLHHPGCTL